MGIIIVCMLEKEMAGNPLQCCLENPMDIGACEGYISWGHKESDTTDVT